MEKVTVHIEAEIHPTENEDKVKKTIQNIFGDLTFTSAIQPVYGGELITAETQCIEALGKLHDLLRRERIRAAARKVLLEGIDYGKVVFFLNKQVAYAGHVSFCQEMAESALGPIRVEIKSENPRKLIDWLTFIDG